MESRLPIVKLATGQLLVWAAIYYVFPALLLSWESDLGWSRAQVTGAIAVAVLTSGLAAPVSGRIIDAGRGAVLMTGAAALGGLSMIALSFVHQIWQFYLVWLVIGLAMSGALYEPCFAVVTRARGAGARSAITAITLIAGFAGTLSFPTVSLLAASFGWRVACVMAGILVLIAVVPLFWTGARALETGSQPDSTQPAQPVGRGYLSLPAFWLLAVGFACAALVHGSTLHHLLPYLDERAVPATLAILIASLIGPMQVAGRLAMVVAGRHVSAHGVAIAAFVLMATSVAALGLGAGTPASLYLFVLCFGGAYGTVSILRPVLAREILGHQNFGAKSGALALPYLAGSASAPYLGSLAWHAGGYGLMLSVSVMLAALGCMFYVAANRLRPAD